MAYVAMGNGLAYVVGVGAVANIPKRATNMQNTKATKAAAAATPAVAPATPVQAQRVGPVRVAAHAGVASAQARLAAGGAGYAPNSAPGATAWFTAYGAQLAQAGAPGSGMAWAVAQTAGQVWAANNTQPPVAGGAVNAHAMCLALIANNIGTGWFTNGSYVVGTKKYAQQKAPKQARAVLTFTPPT